MKIAYSYVQVERLRLRELGSGVNFRCWRDRGQNFGSFINSTRAYCCLQCECDRLHAKTKSNVIKLFKPLHIGPSISLSLELRRSNFCRSELCLCSVLSAALFSLFSRCEPSLTCAVPLHVPDVATRALAFDGYVK